MENRIRHNLHFTVDDQFPPGKLMSLLGGFRVSEGRRGKVSAAVTHCEGAGQGWMNLRNWTVPQLNCLEQFGDKETCQYFCKVHSKKLKKNHSLHHRHHMVENWTLAIFNWKILSLISQGWFETDKALHLLAVVWRMLLSSAPLSKELVSLCDCNTLGPTWRLCCAVLV